MNSRKITCNKCSVEKPATSYWWQWKSKNLRRKTCIECSKATVAKKVVTTPRKCTKCHLIKDGPCFRPQSNQCKSCRLKHVRDRRQHMSKTITVETRECSKCKVSKPARQYRPSRESVGGIRKKCRDCEGIPFK